MISSLPLEITLAFRDDHTPGDTENKADAVVTADSFTRDPGDLTDEALVAAIAGAADKAAFAELFGRYAGRVKGFLIKAGATPDVAEEVAQEVMVSVWRKAATFDGTRASAATWIYTIARNRRIDLLRRAARPQPDPADPAFEPDPEPDPAVQLAQQERDGQVRRALAELTEEQRAVIEMSFFAGLSHGEIAERIDLPLGTVKSRLRLAFGRLRGTLGDGFSGELRDD